MGNKKKYLRHYDIGRLNTKYLDVKVFDSILNIYILFSQSEAKRLNHIVTEISSNFIISFYEKVEFPNTDQISVTFVDIDNEREVDIQRIITEYIKIGDKFDNIGSNCLFISISKLFSLKTEDERNLYLLTCIYNSILAFCEKFQIETTEISNAYNSMCSSDFYLPIILKSYQNKKKTYVARIQSKSGFYYDSYRLALLKIEGLEKTYYKDMQNNRDNFNIEYFEIGQKENSAVLLNRIDFKQYEPFKTGGGEVPPFCFTDEKWINNDVFSFQWGEEEKYEFNLKEMKLRKI